MKTANKFLSTALSLGLSLSPIASVGAKDASKETISPQKARVGTGTTAGQTNKDDDDGLKAGYIISGIAAAALLAIVLEAAFDGKKDRGVTPPSPDGITPPVTTPPATTTTTTTSSGTGN